MTELTPDFDTTLPIAESGTSQPCIDGRAGTIKLEDEFTAEAISRAMRRIATAAIPPSGAEIFHQDRYHGG